MTIKTDIAEGMEHTAVDQGRCSDCVELRKMLKVAGKMAVVVRRLVGGVEFATGYKRSPINVTDLGVAIDELRKLVDEYDKMVFVDRWIGEGK